MSKILEKIEACGEYYKPASKYADYVEVMDIDTKESIFMPASCAFPAMVLGMKDLKHYGEVAIIHDRNAIIHKDGIEETHFVIYQLKDDGYVHDTYHSSNYRIYGECDKA